MMRARTQPRVPARTAALRRLAGLALGVAVASVLVAIVAPGSSHDLRDLGAGHGPGPVVASVAGGAVLTLALFPFPVLAAASGLLFGTALGTAVAVAAETIGALAALLIARRARPADALTGERLRGLLQRVGRRGFAAVLYTRLIPGVPRGIANYAFGMTPVRAGTFTAATALGTAPRAFAYAALGSSAGLGGLDSPQAVAAVAALAVTALIGAAVLVRERRV
jgi:uncharacterized membrane protein YdjX (TVP38/TMEM64 family)